MLIAGIVDAIVQKGQQILMWIFLKIDAIVYNLVSGFYNIFLFLTKINLFNYEDYNNIVKRIYIILGVIMLFVLTYSLLKAVINPDDFAKGENSFPNIIKNVIVSLVIITLLPTIFDVVFRVQAVILNSDVIGKLILSENFSSEVIASGGRTMSTNVFRAFIKLDESARTSADYAGDAAGIENALNEAFLAVESGQSFMIFTNEFVDSYGTSYYFPELIADNAIDYTFIISTVAGVFLLWTIVLFCFDLGIRAIKLIYYQLIAPIAVVCRVMPGKKMKSVFDNWLKYTISTFLEVFIRVFVMYLGVYLITLVHDRMGSIFTAASGSNLNGPQGFLVVAFLIMGVVAFIRQAPKLLQQVFGFESGSLNLGFRKAMAERLGAGGALAAAGLVGGAVGGFGQRLRDARAAGRHGWKAAASAFAGGIGGGRRAFMKNLGSKSMEDFRKNTTEGINDTLAKGRKNDQEKAQFGNKFRAKKNAAIEFLGGGGQLDALNKEKEFYSQITAIDDSSDSAAAELLGRDTFANSTGLIQAAITSSGDKSLNGINMSYGAMQKLLQIVQNTDVNAMLTANGGSFTVTDFYGNTRTITSAADYAVYSQEMQTKFNAVERHTKKYIKTEGYNGKSGVKNIEGILHADGTLAANKSLGGGEMQRMHSLESDRRNVQDLIETNSSALDVLNKNSATRVTRINGYDDMDQLTSNAKDRTKVINADIESRKRRQNGGNNNGGGH